MFEQATTRNFDTISDQGLERAYGQALEVYNHFATDADKEEEVDQDEDSALLAVEILTWQRRMQQEPTCQKIGMSWPSPARWAMHCVTMQQGEPYMCTATTGKG